MRILNSHWIIALCGGLSLVAAAVSLADRSGQELLPPVSARNAQELSTAFRGVANTSMPCVVTIVTNQNARMVDGGQSQERDRLEEMFKNDPRLRDSPFGELFRQMPERQRQMPSRQGMGSGFIIQSTGVILTNNHVVEGADKILVRLQDGREFAGKEVRTDPRTDLAIFRIDAPEELPVLRFGDSDAAQIGDWVVAVGNPFGNELTVTSGIISAKGRGPGIAEREDFLQTDAAINPGNSGGPLLNLNGEVIGVNTAISSRSGGFDGIAYAIPSKMAWWVVNQLIENGSVERAYIGLSIRQLTADIAEVLNLKPGQGALVKDVLAGGPAAKSGLQPGDVVLSLNQEKVTGPRSLQGIVEKLEVGRTYTVLIIRDGKQMTISITLKAMPNQYALSQSQLIRPRPPQSSTGDKVQASKFGFEVQALSTESAEQDGASAGSAVIVSQVEEGGPAFRLLTAGDVIERVGSTRITTLEEFNTAIASIDSERGLLLLVRRGEVTRFVAIRTE